MMRQRLGYLLVVVLGFVFLFWLATPGRSVANIAQPNAGTLTVSPTSQTVGIGDSFSVAVMVAGLDSSLAAFQFDLNYDSALIAPTATNPTTLLGSTGRYTTCPPVVFPSSDSLRVVCASSGDPAGTNAAGTLVNFTFTALAAGVSPLNLTATKMADSDLPPAAITISVLNGSVTVSGPTAITFAKDSGTGMVSSLAWFYLLLFGLLLVATFRVYRQRGTRHLLSFLLVLSLLLGSLSPLYAQPVQEQSVDQPLLTEKDPAGTQPNGPTACYLTNFDCDQDVDENDLDTIAAFWNCASGDSCYSASSDLDNNGLVDAFDLAWVGNDYDIDPPQITLTNPAGSQITTGPLTVAGFVSDDHPVTDLTVNGLAVSLIGNNFSTSLNLSDGNQLLQVIASNELGQEAAASQVALIDNSGPIVAIATPRDGLAIYSRYPDATVHYTDFYSAVDTNSFAATLSDEAGNVSDVTANFFVDLQDAYGSLGGPLNEDTTYTLTVTIADEHGFVGSDQNRFYVPAGVDTIYPPYESPTTGWISGHVYDSATCNQYLTVCEGLAGVQVTAAQIDPESRQTSPLYGTIVTGRDGFYAFPIDQTDFFTLRFEKDGYTYGQREMAVIRGHSTAVSDVYLTPLDPAVTPCDSSGCTHTSSDGLLVVEIPAGAIPDGATLDVTATSFDKVNFLPGGQLPPATQETYAFNLSGTSEINFSQPVTVSIQNYRNFDPGTPIPLGFWNPHTLQWERVGTGRVDPTGQWVVMHVTHFSMYDCNDPIVPPDFSTNSDDETEPDSCPYGGPGCFIHYKSGLLEEEIEQMPTVNVLGQDVSPVLQYATERAYPSAVIDLRVNMYFESNVTLSPYVQTEFYIEGQKTDTFTFAAPFSGDGEVGRYRYLWDGKNALGQPLPPGVYQFAVRLTLTYTGEYCYALYGSFAYGPDCLNGGTGRFVNGKVDQWTYGSVELNGQPNSSFGTGWVLDGQQVLYRDESGRVLVTDGEDVSEYYLSLADNLDGRGQYLADQPPTIGPAAALELSPLPGGGTIVSGTLTNNSTWTPAGSPYEIVGDNLTVADGVNLTIEPGVTVLMEQYRQLLVNGSLTAVGTLANPITFDLYGNGSIDSWKAYTVTNSLAAQIVSSVYAVDVDPAGNVYFAGSTAGYAGQNTLDRLDGSDESWLSVPLPPELSSSLTALAHDVTGRIWLAGGNGVARLETDLTTWTVYNSGNSGLVNDSATSIALDSNGEVWIGTAGYGVSRYNPAGDSWTTYTTADGLADDYVYSVGVDPAGNLWFGTNNGASQRTPAGVWTTYDSNNSPILGNQIKDIAFDPNGDIWFAIIYTGVSVLHPNATWNSYTPADSGLASEHVTSILIDKVGRKWFGHPGSGVSILFGDSAWLNEGRPRLSSNAVNDMALAANGDVWLANGYDGDGGSTRPEAANDNGGATRVRRLPQPASTVDPGFWGALQIGGGANLSDSDSSQLSYVTLRGGGFGRPGSLYLYYSTPSLDHLTIVGSGSEAIHALGSHNLSLDTATLEANEGHGLYFEGGSGSHTLSNLSLRFNSGSGLYLAEASHFQVSNAQISENRQYGLFTDNVLATLDLSDSQVQTNTVAARVPAGSFLSSILWNGNRRNEVEWTAGTINSDTTWGYLPDGPTLYRVLGQITVSDGVTLTIEPGVRVLFDDGLGLDVQGALQAVGLADKVVYFGSTGFGFWDKIGLGGGSQSGDSDSSQLRYVVFNSGGLLLNETAPAGLDHLTFQYMFGSGLTVSNTAGVTLSDSNFLNIYGYAVENITPANPVNAQNNYWGHNTGPYHPELNPTGQGQTVSDGVLFAPWSEPIAMDVFQPFLRGLTATDYSTLTYDPQYGIYLRTYEDGTRVYFNNAGQHEATVTPDGRQTLYSYNYDGTLATWAIVAPGRSSPDWLWQFNYTNGKLSSITDPAGRITTFAINANNHLSQVSYPDGTTHLYYYDPRALLTHQQDRAGDVTSYVYDSYGRLIAHTEPLRPVYDPNTGQTQLGQETRTYTPSDTSYPLLNTVPVGDPGNPSPAAPTSDDLGDEVSYGRGELSGHTNAWGAFLDETDGEGRTTIRQYDERNNETFTLYPDGTCTARTYDQQGNIAQEVKNPAGSCFLDGRLLAPQGQNWNYTYEPMFNQIKTELNPLGNLTRYVYDYEEGVGSAGNLIRVIYPMVADENGQVVTPTVSYTYNLWGQLESETDARGVVTRYVYSQGTADEAFGGSNPLFLAGVTPVPGLLTQKIEDFGGLNRTTTYTDFDAAGYPTTLIGFGGHHTTTRTYDAFNRISAVTDALGMVTTYQYDERGNLLQQVLDYTADGVTGRNILTTYTYDSQDRQLGERTMADGLVVQTNTTYDINGQIATRSDGLGSTTTYLYDNANQEIAVIDPAGQTTSRTYTPDGLLETETDPDGYVRHYFYDYLNLLVGEIADEGGLNLLTIHQYDSLGNRLATSFPDGRVDCYAYDSLNRLRQEQTDCNGLALATNYGLDLNGNRVYVTDRRGIITYTQYDALNRPVLMRQDDGGLNRETVTVYDPAGNIAQEIDWWGVITSYNYNDLNLLTQKCQDAAGLNLCRTYSYDRLHYRQSTTDANGITGFTLNNAWGLPLAITEDDGGLLPTTTGLTYDHALNRHSLTDANGNTTLYNYNARNELTLTTFADGTTISDSYSGRGYLTLRTLPDGATMNEGRDGAGRLVSRTFSNGDSQTFSYTPLGRLQSATETTTGHNSSLSYLYNGPGDVISQTQGLDSLSWTTIYSYNYATGSYTSTYPAGQQISYTTDPLYRLDTVQAGGPLADYDYQDLSSYWTLTYANGLAVRHDYDSLRRTTRISSPLADYRYGYDNESHRTYQQRFDRPGQPADVYQYNSLYQITQVWYGADDIVPAGIGSYDHLQIYTLDPLHNRLTVQNDSLSQSYLPNNGQKLTDPMNRYQQIDSTPLNYDLRGNTLSDGLNSYTYDLLNRQTGLTGPGQSASYLYSAAGTRLAKTINGNTTFFIYDLQHRLIEERAGDNSLLATYVYGSGSDELLRLSRGGNDYYFQRDAQESLTQASDSSGLLVEAYRYDIYGRPTFLNSSGTVIATSAIGNPLLYTGRYYDNESGNYDFRARNYQPTLGRFLQMDSWGFVDGLNLYASYFVVNGTDPSGHQALNKIQVYPPNYRGGYCGYVDWQIRWSLDEPVGPRGGYIVQTLSFESVVTDCKGNKLASPNYRYQEAWKVTAAASDSSSPNYNNITPADTDTYGFNPQKYYGSNYKPTKGYVRWTGTAAYYEGISLVSDFIVNNPKTSAGILPSSTIIYPFKNGTAPVAHTLYATWDCCCGGDQKTKIVSHN